MSKSPDRSFEALQAELPDRWQQLRDDWTGTFDVVVVPSLSLDGIEGISISGVNHYEERMLFALNLLRHPRGRVLYVTSEPLHPATVDYVLSLNGGIPASHMRKASLPMRAFTRLVTKPADSFTSTVSLPMRWETFSVIL